MLNAVKFVRNSNINIELDMDQLKQQFPYLNRKELTKLSNIGTCKRLRKKEILFAAGNAVPYVAYVLKGIIRGYYIDAQGEERTIFLTHQGLFLGAPEAVFYQQPSKYAFEAEVDSEVLVFNAHVLKELGLNNPAIGKMVIDGLSEIIKILISRMELMIEKLPESRFDELLSNRPTFFQAALDKHLANYLGMSAVSFSRIKKRKTRKN